MPKSLPSNDRLIIHTYDGKCYRGSAAYTDTYELSCILSESKEKEKCLIILTSYSFPYIFKRNRCILYSFHAYTHALW